MRMTKKLLLCFVATGWIAVASSGNVSAMPLHEACSADIRHYCDRVIPGNGRIAACLYAHESKISEDCDVATIDVGNVLDTVFETIQGVLSECGPDIEKHCSDVQSGGGQILSCLNEKKTSLAKECTAVLPGISTALSE